MSSLTPAEQNILELASKLNFETLPPIIKEEIQKIQRLQRMQEFEISGQIDVGDFKQVNIKVAIEDEINGQELLDRTHKQSKASFK